MDSMAWNSISDGLPPPKIVNLDAKLTCIKCTQVLDQPRQLPCGHRICKGCTDQLFATQLHVTCPSNSGEEDCGKSIDRTEVNPDNSAQRELRRLLVYCLYKDFGCSQVIPWMHYKTHCEKCEFRLQHCEFCLAGVPASEREMAAHLETCPMKPKPCYFQPFGCTFSGIQSQLDAHDSDHLNHIKLLATRVRQLESELNRFKSEHVQTAETTTVRSSAAEPLRSNDTSLKEAYGSVRAELDRFDAKLMELERDVQQARSSGNVTDDAHEEQWNQMSVEIGKLRKLHADDLAVILESKKSLLEKEFKIQDLEKVVSELRTMNCDGVFVWKIMNYRRRLSATRAGQSPTSLYSQPFYTHRFGYKLCARVYLNGDGPGRGSHVSLFLVVMQGDYDDTLPWPFSAKVNFLLIDQSAARDHLKESFNTDPNSSSFEKPKSAVNIACGCPKFVAHDTLEGATDSGDSSGRLFVQNDIVYLKIVVECADMRY